MLLEKQSWVGFRGGIAIVSSGMPKNNVIKRKTDAAGSNEKSSRHCCETYSRNQGLETA